AGPRAGTRDRTPGRADDVPPAPGGALAQRRPDPPRARREPAERGPRGRAPGGAGVGRPGTRDGALGRAAPRGGRADAGGTLARVRADGEPPAPTPGVRDRPAAPARGARRPEAPVRAGGRLPEPPLRYLRRRDRPAHRAGDPEHAGGARVGGARRAPARRG